MGNFSDSVLTVWNQVFSGIKYQISGENVIYGRDFDKIRFVSHGLLPLGKVIYFPTLTVVIRCVFKQGDLFIHKFI